MGFLWVSVGSYFFLVRLYGHFLVRSELLQSGRLGRSPRQRQVGVLVTKQLRHGRSPSGPSGAVGFGVFQWSHGCHPIISYPFGMYLFPPEGKGNASGDSGRGVKLWHLILVGALVWAWKKSSKCDSTVALWIIVSNLSRDFRCGKVSFLNTLQKVTSSDVFGWQLEKIRIFCGKAIDKPQILGSIIIGNWASHGFWYFW